MNLEDLDSGGLCSSERIPTARHEALATELAYARDLPIMSVEQFCEPAASYSVPQASATLQCGISDPASRADELDRSFSIKRLRLVSGTQTLALIASAGR